MINMSKVVIIPLGTISPYTKNDMNCPGYLIKYNNKKILLEESGDAYELYSFMDKDGLFYII